MSDLVVPGLYIRQASTPDELDVLRATMESVWGPEIVPPRNLLRGLAIGGACLLVAFVDDRPVGFALGWMGWHGGVHFHSHQVGVVADVRGGGVGLALKLAQRNLCLSEGVTEMRWTFDPLLWTNARFNLVRLGAHVVEFLPHCYGDRRDAFNTGEITDRVEVSWRLDRPVGGVESPDSDGVDVIEIPRDYPVIRTTAPELAVKWRAQVGAQFAELIASGGAVVGFGNHGYVVRRGTGS